MNEKEMIEEMVGDIAKGLSGVLLCEVINLAKTLIDLGYRKLLEDSVVLTRGEWEEKLDKQYEKGQLDTRNDFDGKIVLERERFEHLCDLAYFSCGEEEIRKETAKEIFETLYEKFGLEEIGKNSHIKVTKIQFLRIFREILGKKVEE